MATGKQRKQTAKHVEVLTVFPRTYLIFGSFCFAMFFFVWFFIPETKGMSLEAMDELFGVTENSKTDLAAHEDGADDKRPGSATEVEVR